MTKVKECIWLLTSVILGCITHVLLIFQLFYMQGCSILPPTLICEEGKVSWPITISHPCYMTVLLWGR